MGDSTNSVIEMWTFSLFFLFLSIVIILGHKRNEDFIAMFDAYLPAGDYCGQRIPITGWTVRNHICQDNGATGLDANCNSDIFTSAGIFTTPARGVYHCCASFRCKQGGYCDFTVNRVGNGAGSQSGTVYAAFGTRNTGIVSNAPRATIGRQNALTAVKLS